MPADQVYADTDLAHHPENEPTTTTHSHWASQQLRFISNAWKSPACHAQSKRLPLEVEHISLESLSITDSSIHCGGITSTHIYNGSLSQIVRHGVW